MAIGTAEREGNALKSKTPLLRFAVSNLRFPEKLPLRSPSLFPFPTLESRSDLCFRPGEGTGANLEGSISRALCIQFEP